MDKRLYHATCKYVERVMEMFGQDLDLEEWEKLVMKVYKEMEFLVPAVSASEQS